MKSKKYITKGVVIATASIASISVLAGCKTESVVSKEDLVAKFNEAKDLSSAEIKSNYAMDVSIKEETLSIDAEMKVEGSMEGSYASNGDAKGTSTITTTILGTEQKNKVETYLIKNDAGGYDQYTGTNTDGSDTFTWIHSSITDTEYSIYTSITDILNKGEKNHIENFQLDGKTDFEGKSCYVLKGEVAISDLADYISEEGVLSKLIDVSSVDLCNDGEKIEVGVYFDASTKELYGASIDLKALLSHLLDETLNNNGISDAQITVNDSKLNMVYESINKDVTITVPQNVLDAVNK